MGHTLIRNLKEPLLQRCCSVVFLFFSPKWNTSLSVHIMIRNVMLISSLAETQNHTPFFFKVGNQYMLFHSSRYCTPSVRDSAHKTATTYNFLMWFFPPAFGRRQLNCILHIWQLTQNFLVNWAYWYAFFYCAKYPALQAIKNFIYSWLQAWSASYIKTILVTLPPHTHKVMTML